MFYIAYLALISFIDTTVYEHDIIGPQNKQTQNTEKYINVSKSKDIIFKLNNFVEIKF